MDVDVLVVGAGPAGCAAARLLASWGHTTLLLDRAGSAGRRPLAESLPPSCNGLLDAIGIRAAVEEAGFVRSTGNTVWWGDTPRRVEYFPDGATGYQVASDHLEAVLSDAAHAAGATVWHLASLTSIADDGMRYATCIASPTGERAVRARWVLDCTGRARAVARQWRAANMQPAAGATVAQLGPGAPRMFGLVGVWERDAWDLPDASHTLVESRPWGWGWSVPVSRVRRYFTVMLDPAATPLAAGPELAARYHDLLADLPALAAATEGARWDGPAWACDATPYVADAVPAERLLAVGDAASFIDPLSSFGVKKALASAWLAAVVVHSALITPGSTAPALALYAERERAYVSAAHRELVSVYRAAGWSDAGFWGARAALHVDEPESESIERLRGSAEVQRAFDALRTRASARLVPAAGLAFANRPLVRGNVVVEARHLVLPGLEEPVRYLRNVDLMVALEVATTSDDAGAMYGEYTRRLGPVALPDFLGALAVLVGLGGATFA
ncbi:MAG: FAD-dependent monooxygenase [Gemmatimonadaceae bacterium]|nr:FAD-dependent monooxygenase [Gemmatimonadaceae bacterium]